MIDEATFARAVALDKLADPGPALDWLFDLLRFTFPALAYYSEKQGKKLALIWWRNIALGVQQDRRTIWGVPLDTRKDWQ